MLYNYEIKMITWILTGMNTYKNRGKKMQVKFLGNY